jgi:hypothetical protein
MRLLLAGIQDEAREENVKPDGARGGAPTAGMTKTDADRRLSAQSFRTLSLRLRPANDTAAANVPAVPEPQVAEKPEFALLQIPPEPAPEPPAPAPESVSDPQPGADPALRPDVQRAPAAAETGEVVRLLLDIMARPATAAQPQERAMAADILCRLVPRLPDKFVKAICDRVALMREPPAPLLSSLFAHGDTTLVAPLLESAAIGELELERVVATGDLGRIRLIARRRVLPQGLVARLVASDDPAVLLAVLRNPGAELSVDVFRKLANATKTCPVLQAPLMTRSETPPAIAFDLFFDLPPELRRYVLTRFLADSSTIGRMLKIVATIDRDNHIAPAKADLARIVEALALGDRAEAARLLVGAAGLPLEAAQVILADTGGEPLTITCKAIGMSRKDFAICLERQKAGGAPQLSQGRDPAELQRLFDSLSYNKAKVLLTYWSWRFPA